MVRALAGLMVAGVTFLAANLVSWPAREVYGNPRPSAPCLPAGDRTCLSASGFIEYIGGDLPIVISVPHGGQLSPDGLDDRIGSWGSDVHTIELGLAVAESFIAETGRRPSLVVSHLNRRKLDPNRDLADAARGDRQAAEAWREYHAFVDDAIRRTRGRGLYIDLHGHSHEKHRVELGYLLDNADLAADDAGLDQLAGRSSLAPLVTTMPSVRLSSLVRGPTSLGSLLQPFIETVPSTAVPGPGDDAFYAGGYSTERHSASIPGLQIETPFEGVRDTEEHRRAFARTLAEALVVFAREHLGLEF